MVHMQLSAAAAEDDVADQPMFEWHPEKVMKEVVVVAAELEK